MNGSLTDSSLKLHSLVITLALLLLVFLLGTSSTGSVRNPGDRGDDDGSGIGGTGKSAFIGSIDLPRNEFEPDFNVLAKLSDKADLASGANHTPYEIPIGLIEPEMPLRQFDAGLDPIQLEFKLVEPDIKTSHTLDIAESIQNLLFAKAALYVSPMQVTDRSDEISKLNPHGSANTIAKSSWTTLKEYLIDEMASDGSAASPIKIGSEIEGIDIQRRSDDSFRRIQRPELPPVQRVRPIERISVLPPRVQPMRI